MNKLHVAAILFFFLANAGSGYAQTVYAAEKGQKYHTGDCKYSGDAKDITLTAAKKAGKKACDICKPDDVNHAKLTRCVGKTKEGLQCKRMTASKSKKCYQHAGSS